ncbi:MAG: ABC transporter transmembrane domain-containing protein [Rhodospirillales bacterium]|nr:ABC transporter [Rhodospirillaceae bacterium]MDP6428518.1 ABC transporter transmembrane domain-containing protein [Rhodospirillales bacterium]MDP6646164.1 ABC transporter transmembrane domain-containing protein [Rhodospirillales bacterium]MDP6843448.1 ABC transporter transmembrane domain-containing protein [Rhodospirillales bacterium]
MARSSIEFERPKGKNLRYLSRTAGFLKPYWRRVIAAVTALSVTALAILALGQGLRQLIDSGFAGGDSAALDRALIMLLSLSAVMAVGMSIRFYLVSWLGERVVADLRQAVFDRVMTLHAGFFEVTKTGEVLSRLTTDTTLLQSVIGSSASIAMRNAFNLVGGVIMLFVTNPVLTGLVLLVVPVVVAPIMIFGRRVRRLSRASQDRVADVGAFAEETINAMRTVQAFTHEAEDSRRFAGEVWGAFSVAVSRIRMRALLTAMVVLLVFGAIGVILWIGGRDMQAGEISGGELAAFIYYATIVAFSVGVISEVYGELLRAAGATERLIELLEAEPDIAPPDVPLPLPAPAAGRVSFDNVTFHYPSRPGQAALAEFSLNVAPGETVALVGPSGAGKSTVFQLLLRFYDPSRGSISLDGVDVRLADTKAVRERFALVPQDPVIFSTDGLENIRYGRPEAGDAAVRRAAEAAAADEFLDQLPDGFATFLGEKGVRLSGGQRQRISLARALLRDPAVLLLDEATSALDAESERLVQAALEKLKAGRTTLVIAHRLATVIGADRIVVIDQGRLVASGTHTELLQSSPLYAHLAALQFEHDTDAPETMLAE